jgi:predicted dithiol-disulfide oxidoreductase (DUF899 family)
MAKTKTRNVRGASPEYRTRRAALLKAEIALRNQSEKVAEMRRQLPLGARVKDYVFREGPPDLAVNSPTGFFDTPLSELFLRGRDSLIVIQMMFSPDDDLGCPMCSMWADGYNAIAQHVGDKTNFVLVAKAEIGKLRDYARARGWTKIRLLSCHDNTFNRDLEMEDKDGKQMSGISVFRRKADGIYHFYSCRGTFQPNLFRGIDPYTPVWNLFDLLPEGREDWFPEHFYH